MKIRVGALNGKRVDYFKGVAHSFHSSSVFLTLGLGKSAVNALLSPAYAKLKNVPPVTNEAEAEAVLTSIIPYAFYLRVDRGNPTGSSSSAPRHVAITAQQSFAQDGYFAWFYEGSQWTTYAGGLLMVAIMLAGVMFPLWPPIMRLGVWYISVGMLGLFAAFFALAIVRLVFYVISIVVVPPGIWIFPKLFADVGVVSSAQLSSRELDPLMLFHRLNRSFRCGSGTFQRRRAVKRKRARRPRGKRERKSRLTIAVLPLKRRLRAKPRIPRVLGAGLHV